MDITLNTPVYCLDGHAGHVSGLILHAKGRSIRALVVKGKALSRNKWIVPITEINNSTSKRIEINCTLEQLRYKRPFHVTEHIAAELPVHNSAMIWGGGAYIPKERRFITLKRHDLGVGELALKVNAPVHGTDGLVGNVRNFLVEAQSGQITHLTLQGYLGGQRKITIPIYEIDNLGDNVVYLKLSKQQIAKLSA